MTRVRMPNAAPGDGHKPVYKEIHLAQTIGIFVSRHFLKYSAVYKRPSEHHSSNNKLPDIYCIV